MALALDLIEIVNGPLSIIGNLNNDSTLEDIQNFTKSWE